MIEKNPIYKIRNPCIQARIEIQFHELYFDIYSTVVHFINIIICDQFVIMLETLLQHNILLNFVEPHRDFRELIFQKIRRHINRQGCINGKTDNIFVKEFCISIQTISNVRQTSSVNLVAFLFLAIFIFITLFRIIYLHLS